VVLDQTFEVGARERYDSVLYFSVAILQKPEGDVVRERGEAELLEFD